MPSFISEEAQDLLNLILNPDPAQRFTITDIRAHPWFN
jgi:5'-AMP-activated protein kinase catalytic alpha subunit